MTLTFINVARCNVGTLGLLLKFPVAIHTFSTAKTDITLFKFGDHIRGEVRMWSHNDKITTCRVCKSSDDVLMIQWEIYRKKDVAAVKKR